MTNIFLFIPLFKQLTSNISTLDGSNDADSHKGVPFWLWLVFSGSNSWKTQILKA